MAPPVRRSTRTQSPRERSTSRLERGGKWANGFETRDLKVSTGLLRKQANNSVRTATTATHRGVLDGHGRRPLDRLPMRARREYRKGFRDRPGPGETITRKGVELPDATDQTSEWRSAKGVIKRVVSDVWTVRSERNAIRGVDSSVDRSQISRRTSAVAIKAQRSERSIERRYIHRQGRGSEDRRSGRVGHRNRNFARARRRRRSAVSVSVSRLDIQKEWGKCGSARGRTEGENPCTTRRRARGGHRVRVLRIISRHIRQVHLNRSARIRRNGYRLARNGERPAVHERNGEWSRSVIHG